MRDLELGSLQRSEPGVACGIRGWENGSASPCPSPLGWAAMKEGEIREGDTEDCEVQREKQMLSRVLPQVTIDGWRGQFLSPHHAQVVVSIGNHLGFM